MKQLTSEEIKKKELNILIKFSDFCEKNNLRYYLAYGTLLGAIRHKGFIPWDDDIDVMMPRSDYTRFLELTGYNPIYDKFETRLYRDCKNPCIYPFIKVEDMTTIVFEAGKSKKYVSGVWIDIFPMDGYPESKEDADINFKKYLKLRHAYDLAITNPFYVKQAFIKKCIKIFFVPFMKLYGINKLCKKLEDMSQKYPYESSKAIAECIWADNSHSYLLKEELEPCCEVSFEGHNFKAPGNYNTYLTRIYGDYMTLPAESERIQHRFKAYVL